LPKKAHSLHKGPKYVSASAKGVTITLTASTAGLSGISGTTDLTAPGVCVNNVCTVEGPPIPPGNDTLDVGLYFEEPTGSPAAEPAGAHLLAQSTSTATPAVSDQPVTITAGADNQVSILLYGVPAILTITNGVSSFTADSMSHSTDAAGEAVPLAVEDYGGNPITGQFSAPVTVTDSDTAQYQTALAFSTGGTPGGTQTLNSAADVANLVAVYGGLAEAPPTITATAPGGITSGAATPFNILLNTIVIAEAPGPSTQTSDEIDLFAPTGTGSTANFVVSEAGWSDSPYNKTFTVGSVGTCTTGTQAATYSLSTADNLTFTDTAPAAPANGVCTVPVTDFTNGQSATEELTYTTTSIIIDKKNRLLHRSRTH